MTNIYEDGTYKSSNPTWHAQDAPWKARQIAGIMQKNHVTPSTVAEVGCGTGEILAQLSNVFPDATFAGFDISEDAIELAQARAGERLRFEHSDPLGGSEHFDVVIVADVIEHVDDPFAFSRGVDALGDVKVFHIPLDLSVQSVLRMSPILNLRKGVGHIHYFTKDTALALLAECGLEVIDWTYTASRLELPNQALSSKIVAPLRRLASRINRDLTVRVLGGYSLLVLAR